VSFYPQLIFPPSVDGVSLTSAVLAGKGFENSLDLEGIEV
jgi:hypothetical protein